MAYEKLFTPGRIGPLTIRNRAVMSPMGTDFADTNGNASPRLIAYYAERAKGGIGLIINEYTGVDDVDSIPTQHNLRMAQDYNVKAAEELTEKQYALCEYAWYVTKHADEIGEEQIEKLRAVGFNDHEILEAAYVAGFFNYTNRWVSTIGPIANPGHFSHNRNFD